jgi:hypothetical protein
MRLVIRYLIEGRCDESHQSCRHGSNPSVEALVKSCQRLGTLELVEGKTYKWFGQSVGDYPLPVGFTAADMGKCDFVIRVTDSALEAAGLSRDNVYEVGVVRRRDGKPGYMLMYDFWNNGYGLMPFLSGKSRNGEDANLLFDAYAIETTIESAIEQGFTPDQITEEVDEHGNVDVVIEFEDGSTSSSDDDDYLKSEY